MTSIVQIANGPERDSSAMKSDVGTTLPHPTIPQTQYSSYWDPNMLFFI